MKKKMTLEELQNMVRMVNNISFAKGMWRDSKDIKKVLSCIIEWPRGDDEPSRLKREKNT